MKIVAIDQGFSDSKVVAGDEFGVKNVFKFPGVVGIVSKNEMVNDDRLVPLDE